MDADIKAHCETQFPHHSHFDFSPVHLLNVDNCSDNVCNSLVVLLDSIDKNKHILLIFFFSSFISSSSSPIHSY